MGFKSAYQRIDWANEQIDDLKRESVKFLAAQRYERVSKLDVDGRHTIDKLRLGGPLPDSLTRFTVQAIENLRSALDHATCAVVVGSAGKKGTHFPFGDTKREFDKAVRTRCKHVPDEIKALFRSFKPYKRGNPPIWALNKICNTHKHRTIIEPTRTIRKFTIMDVPFELWLQLSRPARPAWNRRKNEIVISRAPGEGTVHNDVEFFVGIAFGKVPIFVGAPALATLRYLTREVNSIVMAIEAEARRIGIAR
jgi:hypothetical protein